MFDSIRKFLAFFTAAYATVAVACAGIYIAGDGMPVELALLFSFDTISTLGRMTGEWIVMENGVDVVHRLDATLSVWTEKIEAVVGMLAPAFVFGYFYHRMAQRRSD